MNVIEKCFLVQKMDGCRDTMFHQILGDHHLKGTSSKTKKGLVDNSSHP